MFNPKQNLLEEELSYSGMEMTVDPFSVIAAGTGIIGGIMGSSQASKQNAAARKAEKEQKKLAQKQADITNEYNQRAFEAEKKDYYAQRAFQWETANRDFDYANAINDYRYLQDVRQYGKSVNTYNQTLAFNSIASNQAYESVQAQFNELLQGQAFAKQNMMVERLSQQGQIAASGQAGRSQQRRQQVTIAEQGLNLAVMREELRSADRNAQANLRDVAIQRFAADENAKAALMLRPERAPAPLRPIMGPERTFVEPAEALPSFVPPAVQQSTMMPLISGIGSAAGSLVGQFNKPAPTPTNKVGS